RPDSRKRPPLGPMREPPCGRERDHILAAAVLAEASRASEPGLDAAREPTKLARARWRVGRENDDAGPLRVSHLAAIQGAGRLHDLTNRHGVDDEVSRTSEVGKRQQPDD